MIEVYKTKDYKKSGGLKKNAVPVFVSNEQVDSALAVRLKQTMKGFAKPYFFTHIDAYMNNVGREHVRIVQKVQIANGDQLLVSPTKLANLLIA